MSRQLTAQQQQAHRIAKARVDLVVALNEISERHELSPSEEVYLLGELLQSRLGRSLRARRSKGDGNAVL